MPGPDRWTFALAAGSLALAMATGVGAQTGVVDTSSVRWVHHALYGATVVTSLVALVATRRPGRRLALTPAVVALAGLPRTHGGTRDHATRATFAAACYVAAAPLR